MQKFLFHIGYGILYLFSLIPFWFMYIISDVVAFCMDKVFHYRSDVIRGNLKKAFPHYSEKEINKIKRDFYQRFCDNFLETIKLLSISKSELNKRFVTDSALLHKLYKEENNNVSLVLGHFFNWEMANPAIALKNPFEQLIVYKKVKNTFFEKIMIKIREGFNTKMIASSEFSIHIRKYVNTRHSLVLLADQNPSYDSVTRSFWTTFFGYLVPFVKGPEKTAIINNNTVVFSKVFRTKRGYYRNELILLTNEAANTKRGQITKQIVSLLEENIKDDPANYLWSHKRFKHEYKEQFKKNLIE